MNSIDFSSVPPVQRFSSVEDFISFEETAEEKHEYHQGLVSVVAGETIAHNQIVRNVISEPGFF